MAKNTSVTHTAQKSPSGLPFDAFKKEGMFKYKALFDSNMIGVASTDFEDTIFNANDAFLAIIGYSQEEFVKKPLRWSEISPSKYDEADIEKINELLKNKTIVPFEKEYIHKKGHAVPVLVGAEAMDDDASYGVCFALDISKLKDLEQKKDDFIGIVSHELKTPLAIMKLYAGFVEDGIKKGESKEELLESVNEISNQIDKLSIQITDLLNMARYESNEFAFPVNALDPDSFLSKTVADLALVQERTVTYESEGSIYINGNKDRLVQVVINLVNNAIRYSSPESEVKVKVSKTQTHARICVQDFGMGISKENIGKIFERYYRINHADDYAGKGVGIGLHICSEIIKYHRGTIEVESTPGKGSSFTVVLPLIK